MKSGSSGPRFALSSRSTPLLGFEDLARAAHASSLDGTDLDLTASAFSRRIAGNGRLNDLEGVASLWISSSPRSLDEVATHGPGLGTGMIVVDEERGSVPNGREQLATAIKARGLVPPQSRVALAVRPRNPEAGRAHLARLSLLRNFAEEWDLDLALDLSGPIDWLWEAEAAVFRLAPRLRLLRIVQPLPALDAQTRTRMTQRTIAACVDAGFDGLIAVVCPLPFWRWHSVPALVRATVIAVDRLSDRFGIVSVRPYQDLPQRSSTP